MSCGKAQEFLEASGQRVASTTDARREPKGPADALALAHAVDRVIVARGRKVVTFDMQSSPPSDEVLIAHLLGPTGNLRAPTIQSGRILLVGFSKDCYEHVLGK